mmetsp:Transcript_20398/g.26300  ORF Transcript_20398/g.26300 Transcript_20398/m.26300 type:complete len:121 (+) Transcript_20398:160-522(+)
MRTTCFKILHRFLKMMTWLEPSHSLVKLALWHLLSSTPYNYLASFFVKTTNHQSHSAPKGKGPLDMGIPIKRLLSNEEEDRGVCGELTLLYESSVSQSAADGRFLDPGMLVEKCGGINFD